MVRVVKFAVAFLYPVEEVLQRRWRDLVKRQQFIMNEILDNFASGDNDYFVICFKKIPVTARPKHGCVKYFYYFW